MSSWYRWGITIASSDLTAVDQKLRDAITRISQDMFRDSRVKHLTRADGVIWGAEISFREQAQATKAIESLKVLEYVFPISVKLFDDGPSASVRTEASEPTHWGFFFPQKLDAAKLGTLKQWIATKEKSAVCRLVGEGEAAKIRIEFIKLAHAQAVRNALLAEGFAADEIQRLDQVRLDPPPPSPAVQTTVTLPSTDAGKWSIRFLNAHETHNDIRRLVATLDPSAVVSWPIQSKSGGKAYGFVDCRTAEQAYALYSPLKAAGFLVNPATHRASRLAPVTTTNPPVPTPFPAVPVPIPVAPATAPAPAVTVSYRSLAGVSQDFGLAFKGYLIKRWLPTKTAGPRVEVKGSGVSLLDSTSLSMSDAAAWQASTQRELENIVRSLVFIRTVLPSVPTPCVPLVQSKTNLITSFEQVHCAVAMRTDPESASVKLEDEMAALPWNWPEGKQRLVRAVLTCVAEKQHEVPARDALNRLQQQAGLTVFPFALPPGAFREALEAKAERCNCLLLGPAGGNAYLVSMFAGIDAKAALVSVVGLADEHAATVLRDMGIRPHTS